MKHFAYASQSNILAVACIVDLNEQIQRSEQ
jgi:hypothetical protein